MRSLFFPALGEERVIHLHDHFDFLGTDGVAGKPLPFADFGVGERFRAGLAASGQIPEPVPDVLDRFGNLDVWCGMTELAVTFSAGLALLVLGVVPDEKASAFDELFGQF